MLVVHRSRAPRSLALAAVAAALAGAVVSAPGTALADDGALTAGDTVVGTLVQAWPEYDEPAEAVAHGDAGPLSWIEQADGSAVRVPTDDLAAAADAAVGATVAVTVGREVVDEAAAEEGLDPARTVLDAAVLAPAAEPATAPAAAPITDAVTVVMVVPRGGSRDGRTLQQVVDAVSGPVARFWSAQSDGRVRVGVTASFGWRTARHDCTDASGLWSEVAAGVGWTRGPGRHLLLYLPGSSADCAYGLAEIGSSLTSGGRLYVRDTATSVIAHELGHNLGLGHSSALQCNGSVEGSGCATAAYSDWYDVMGYSWQQVGTLNVAQADRLGLLRADERIAVPAQAPAATYTLVPVAAATGTRAVELTDRDGTHYWLEYRQASGQDAWLGTWANLPGLDAGVVLHRSDDLPVSGARPDSSLLLDGTPAKSAGWAGDRRVAFPVGRTVAVAGGNFSVTVRSVTAGGAVVRIDPAASPIAVRYAATGGARGVLGAATRAEVCGLRGGGCYQRFAGGSIYWSPATPAVVVRGAALSRWGALGYERGWLGYPVADARCGLAQHGCVQEFQVGSLYRTDATGVLFVRGQIRARWLGSGGATGTLGYPTTDEICGLTGGGCGQKFQRGVVYWTPATGAHPVSGSLLTAWKAAKAERGALGYPVGEPRAVGRDTTQRFQHGTLTYVASTRRVRVS